jgi:hypothetical protein
LKEISDAALKSDGELFQVGEANVDAALLEGTDVVAADPGETFQVGLAVSAGSAERFQVF